MDERALQERFVVILPSMIDWKSAKTIPDSALVAANSSTFDLMGIPNGLLQSNKDGTYYLTWSELMEVLHKRAANIAPWLNYVESSILAQLSVGISAPTQLSFVATDKKAYRPILGRYKLFRNGRRKYYIQLIQGLEKTFPGRDDTSVLLIGLIFAARFYVKFHEDADNLMKSFSDDKSDNEFNLEVRALDSYVRRTITEASEYGLSDRESIKAVLNLSPDESDIIDHFFVIWDRTYDRFAAAMKKRLNGDIHNRQEVRNAIRSFAEEIRSNNNRFMQMMFSKLSSRLPLAGCYEPQESLGRKNNKPRLSPMHDQNG